MKKVITYFAIVSMFLSCDMARKEGGKSKKNFEIEVNEISEIEQLAKQSQETLEIANAYIAAMGKGDMETMENLMHEDMVWQNAGDSSLPWVGPWNGKKVILEEFFSCFQQKLCYQEMGTY